MFEGLKGPDLLEAYAERNENQGFHMEAQILSTAARQWREDLGEFAPPTRHAKPLVSAPLAPAKTIPCKVVFANAFVKLVQLEVSSEHRLPVGMPCWLVPLEPVS